MCSWSAVLLLCSVALAQGQEYAEVRTESNGNLKGYKIKSLESKDVNAFIGVPFAKPPVGDLRFKRPEPLESSGGTYEALTKRTMCPQSDMRIPGITLDNSFNSDDCLYMNIFASTSDTKKKPVMVFFYGGFFQWGDNNLGLYDGVEFAAETDSVIVFPSYRVNVFGFLNSTTSSAPGNAGLFDQLFALKWVKKNIAAFGGDPNLVTIAGQSAGAISSSVHTSSPASKGLFKRAILLSGTSSTLAFQTGVDGQTLLFNLANFLDCFNTDKPISDQYGEMTDCIKKIDSKLVIDELTKLGGTDALGFGPGIDGEIIAGSVKKPMKLSYNVEDVMIGTTEADGELILGQIMQIAPGFENLARNSGPGVALRLAFRQMFGIDASQGGMIYEEYITEQENEEGYDVVIKKAPRLITDVAFDCPAKFYMNAVEKVNRGKTRIYRYLMVGPRSKAFADNLGAGNATHSDELPFFLGTVLNKELVRPWEPHSPAALVDSLAAYTDEDRKFGKNLLKSIKQFMLNGNPSVPGSHEKWPLYSEKSPSVVHIEPKGSVVIKGSISNKCHLWAPYLVDGDINELYAAPTTTTTTTKAPYTKKPRPFNREAKNFQRSRSSQHFNSAQDIVPSLILVLAAPLLAALF